MPISTSISRTKISSSITCPLHSTILIIIMNLSSATLSDYHLSSPSWESCSSLKSCKECTSSISSSSLHSCHWCSFDKQCHTIGSLYGCAWGVHCNSIEQCERQEAERVGISAFTLQVMICLGACTFLVRLYLFSTTKKFPKTRNLNTTATTYDSQVAPVPVVVEHQNLLSQTQVVKNETTATTTNIPVYAEYNFNKEEKVNQNYSYITSRSTTYGTVTNPHDGFLCSSTSIDYVPVSSVTTERYKRKTSYENSFLSWACRILSASLLAATVSSLYLLFPKPPEIDFCTTELAWNTIITNMIDFNFVASFEILVSIYNSNPYDIMLNLASGTFYHDGVVFGSYQITPTSVQKFSINDDLVLVSFAPQGWQGFKMISEYYDYGLNFTVHSVFTVTLPTLRNVSFTASLNSTISGLSASNTDRGDVVDDDSSDNTKQQNQNSRNLCACP